MRQLANRVLHLLESAVEPGFQLRQGHVRHMAFVEDCEGEAKLGPELFEAYFRALRLAEDIIRRLPDRGQIVHERARPVEDDISNHTPSVIGFRFTATDSR